MKLHATVAQQVEQLTRNEQVVRSNRIGSSNKKQVARLAFLFFGDIIKTTKQKEGLYETRLGWHERRH